MKKTLKRELFMFTAIIILVIFVTGSAAFYLFSRTAFESEERITLKNTVEMILLVIEDKQRDVSSGLKTTEQAQDEVVEMLSKSEVINLGAYGYPVILNQEGYLVYHPELGNQYALDLVDESKEKKLFVREQVDAAHNGGGFTTYQWKKPSTDQIDEKIVYSKLEPNWNWVVEAASFKSDYGLNARNLMLQTLFVLVLIFGAIMYINHYYLKNITNPIKHLVSTFENNHDTEHNLISATEVIEYQALYEGYNNMMRRLAKSYKTIQDKNEDLEAANDELSALYEEMAAAEETLQSNYDELQNYKTQIEEEKSRYEKVIKSSYDAYWIYDPEKQIIKLENFYHFFMEKEIPYEDFLVRIYEDDLNNNAWIKEMGVIPDAFTKEAIVRLKDNDNNLRWFKLLYVQEKSEKNQPVKMFGSLKDIHEMQLEKSRIEFTAYHDDKTGLYNYEYIVIKLAEKRDCQTSLTMVGLRNIQHLRNVYGKNFVQIVMFQIAGILNELFGSTCDVCVFDENKIVIYSDASEMDNGNFDPFLERVKEIKFEDILFPKDLIITIYNKDGSSSDVQSIFRKLEYAYDYNDQEYRGSYVNYVDDQCVSIMERKGVIEQHLLKSIQLNELSLVYQPIVDAEHKIEGFEALVRWHNHSLGSISPTEFIPIAEEIDFICEIGTLVMEKACEFLLEIEAAFKMKMRISINASVRELIKSDYVQSISNQLEKYKIEPWQISIEITESSFSKFFDALKNTLSELAELGIETHMDDFGTGYSSLNLLGSLNVSHLKIDRSFIIDILNDQKMAQLTEMIVEFSHKLGIKTIVEGIEDFQSFEMLKNWKCDYFQGYYFSKPLDHKGVFKALVHEMDEHKLPRNS